MRAAGLILAMASQALLSACAAAGIDVDGGAAGPPAPFPECGAGPFAFVGRTTLAAIGLSSGGGDSGRVGTIWVTAEPVDNEVVGLPAAPGQPAPRPTRWVCVEWPDTSGMAMPVEDAWEPPGGVPADDGAANPSPPIGAIALAVGALAVIAVSWFAFRREASSSP